MAIYVPFEGLHGIITYVGNMSAYIQLIKDNFTPAESDEIADYEAIEADFSGYTDGGISIYSPTVDSGPDDDDRAVVRWATMTWTHNGGGTANTIYGYFLRAFMGGHLLWVEKFSAPIIMGASGHTVSIIPELRVGRFS